MLDSIFPEQPSPKTPPPPLNFRAPRLETPRFDPLSFPHILSSFLENDAHLARPTGHNSSVDLSCGTKQYTCIKDVMPEWGNEEDSLLEDSPSYAPIARSRRHQPFIPDKLQCSQTSSLFTNPVFSDRPALMDFLIDPIPLEAGNGTCIRRSNGQVYSIKRQPQTPQVWSELDILLKIKEAHAPFSPLLHWTYESDQYVYFIMENYTRTTLADAIGHYGTFGPFEIFFYACELLMGLISLRDLGIIHCNVSPGTIIFDKKGHLILSGVENGTVERLCKNPSTSPGSDRRYQAPEVLLGWGFDHLVDSWSFGLVLYFMFHGKHALLDEVENSGRQFGKDVKKIILEGVPNKAVRFINPVVRDLILRCLELNPALRLTTQDIQRHPYFSNADWEKVLEQASPAPLPRELLTRNVIQSPAISSDPNFSSLEQCFSPRVSVLSLKNCQQPFGQAVPQLLRSPFVIPSTRGRISQTSVVNKIASRPSDVKKDITRAPQVSQSPLASSVSLTQVMTRAPIEGSDARMADFWESLEQEDGFSARSEYSALSNAKMPFSRAWNLRKERSFMIYPQRLFSLSTASIQRGLRRRPKSVAALKHAEYAEPIANLPSGLSQIGSGIGFTCTAPSVPSFVLDKSEAAALETGTVSECSALGLSFDAPPRVSRNSISSDYTVAVPKACHGLLRGLNVSSFWPGIKNGSVGVSTATISPPCLIGCVKESEQVTGVNGRLTSPVHISSSRFEEHCKEKEECQPELIQPLAESTAFLSPVTEAFSPSGFSLPTSSTTTTEEEVFTPDTTDFPPGSAIRVLEEIIETKRNDEAYPFRPESTLRLVTSMNGLRLEFTDGPYSI